MPGHRTHAGLGYGMWDGGYGTEDGGCRAQYCNVILVVLMAGVDIEGLAGRPHGPTQSIQHSIYNIIIHSASVFRPCPRPAAFARNYDHSHPHSHPPSTSIASSRGRGDRPAPAARPAPADTHRCKLMLKLMYAFLLPPLPRTCMAHILCTNHF